MDFASLFMCVIKNAEECNTPASVLAHRGWEIAAMDGEWHAGRFSHWSHLSLLRSKTDHLITRSSSFLTLQWPLLLQTWHNPPLEED
jgi:hypothetical protein